MKLRTKLIAWAIVLLTVTAIGFSTIQPAKAQFVLSGWDYDDGYGQGIEVVWFYENSTGSWVAILDPAFILPTDSTAIEMNYSADTAIKIIVTCNINHSLFDFGPDKSENASARAIMRTSINVTIPGENVFSQNNLTWDGSVFDDTATTWAISFEVVINVIIISGGIYTVTLEYEIFW